MVLLTEEQKNDLVSFLVENFPNVKPTDIHLGTCRDLFKSLILDIEINHARSSIKLIAKIRKTPNSRAETMSEYKKYKEIEKIADGKSYAPLVTIGCVDTLPALLSFKIDGNRLSDVFKHANEIHLLNWVALCGEFIGLFHNHFRIYEIPRQDMQNAIHGYLDGKYYSKEFLDELTDNKISLSYDDFTLANTFINNDGKLSFLDPPEYDDIRFIHYDIAIFRHSLLLNVMKRCFTTLNINTSLFTKLYKAFLDSYQNTTGTNFTEHDHYMVNRISIWYLKHYTKLRSLIEDWKSGVNILHKMRNIPVNYCILVILQFSSLLKSKPSFVD